MNNAHIHLVLNHIPIIGLGIVLFLLVLAELKRSVDIRRAGWILLILIGIIAIPTYFTGDPAEQVLEHSPIGETEEWIQIHEERAGPATLITLASALLAGICLWKDRSKKLAPGPLIIITLLTALLAFGAMLWTAQAGGKIRHTEIRYAPPPGF